MGHTAPPTDAPLAADDHATGVEREPAKASSAADGVDETRSRSRSRRWLFRVVALSPLLLLLGALVVRVVEIRTLDLPWLLEELDATLKTKPGEGLTLTTRHGVRGQLTFDGKLVPLDGSGHKPVIHAFGGSSLVTPMDVNFLTGLESELTRRAGRRIRVVNLGHLGLDMHSVALRVRDSLALSTPDLLLIYSGHNDLSFSYWAVINPYFYVIVGSPVLEPVVRQASRAYRALHGLWSERRLPSYHMFWLSTLEPAALGLFQRLGLIAPSLSFFEAVTKAAMRSHAVAMAKVIKMAKHKKIPLLIVTPISNLYYPPRGIGGNAEATYRKGMATKNFEARNLLLREAKDQDVFSGMIRAKSVLLEYQRGLRQKGVWVHDLEQELFKRRVPLDNQHFTDALHLSPKMHRIMAESIGGYIVNNHICCGL